MLEVHRLVGPPPGAPQGVMGLYAVEPPHGAAVERTSFALEPHSRLSLDSYVNGLPVGYWRAHTDVRAFALRGRLDGPATVRIRTLDAHGVSTDRGAHVSSGSGGSFELTTAVLDDDVWCWVELTASELPVRLHEAGWWASVGTAPRLGVAITTYDRPSDCVAALHALGQEDGIVERVVVVDQGRRRVRDEPGYPQAAVRWGEQLTLVEQPNLGGSGGYARGMHELLSHPALSHVVLMDDDVVVEPEALRRMGAFGAAAGETVVGGQMLELTRPTVLHSTGEAVDRRRYWWGPAPGAAAQVELSGRPLSAVPVVPRVTAVDFNGWWMCLLPTATLRRLGLPLPMFIKWDDVEYGLRAQRCGVRTVTLPGAAVWHLPWTGKDASRDWQAFFLTRNRLVVAALDTRRTPWGLLRHLTAHGLSHLVTMSYSSADMVVLGVEEFLAGPERLVPTMTGGPGALAGRRDRFGDSRPAPPPAGVPTHQPPPPTGRWGTALAGARGAVRAVVGRSRAESPQCALALADARWPVLARLDHVWVGDAADRDGSFRSRDRGLARRTGWRMATVVLRAGLRWPSLSARYREAAGPLSTPHAWEPLFTGATRGSRVG